MKKVLISLGLYLLVFVMFVPVFFGGIAATLSLLGYDLSTSGYWLIIIAIECIFCLIYIFFKYLHKIKELVDVIIDSKDLE